MNELDALFGLVSINPSEEKPDQKQLQHSRISFIQSYRLLKLVPNKVFVEKSLQSTTPIQIGNLPPDTQDTRFQQDFCDEVMRQSRNFILPSANQDQLEQGLLVSAYHDFVDRYIVRNIREPQPPIPADLFDDNM